LQKVDILGKICLRYPINKTIQVSKLSVDIYVIFSLQNNIFKNL